MYKTREAIVFVFNISMIFTLFQKQFFFSHLYYTNISRHAYISEKTDMRLYKH